MTISSTSLFHRLVPIRHSDYDKSYSLLKPAHEDTGDGRSHRCTRRSSQYLPEDLLVTFNPIVVEYVKLYLVFILSHAR